MLGGRRSVLSNRIEEAFRDRRSCISLTPLGSTATRRGFTGHVAAPGRSIHSRAARISQSLP